VDSVKVAGDFAESIIDLRHIDQCSGECESSRKGFAGDALADIAKAIYGPVDLFQQTVCDNATLHGSYSFWVSVPKSPMAISVPPPSP
jgi:hypothetical protein